MAQVQATASGRILFRIKANIGHCHLALEDVKAAIENLEQAFDHAPAEPKAISNKALSLFLKEDYNALSEFCLEGLKADPSNTQLAGYFIQGSIADPNKHEPWNEVPANLLDTFNVLIAKTTFLRSRGKNQEWWSVALQTRELHPTEPYARRFGAEADLDKIAQTETFRIAQAVSPDERETVRVASLELAPAMGKDTSR